MIGSGRSGRCRWLPKAATGVLAAIMMLAAGGSDARQPNGKPSLPLSVAVAGRSPVLLPASSPMPLGEWRLPPPGYVDYCLRFKSRDRGCLT